MNVGLTQRPIALKKTTAQQVPKNVGPAPVSQQSSRGLDWFVFFVADIQTGFGPFVAVFLTTQKWTQVDIGLVLTISGLVSLIGQVPLGALVDAVSSVRTAAIIALAVIGASAFTFATWPIFPVVLVARVFHAAASSMLSLALVSITLSLFKGRGISERLGRNVAFASAGTGIAAAVMGACGYYLSSRTVFFLAGALVLPAIIALCHIRPDEIRPTAGASSRIPKNSESVAAGLGEIVHNRPLIIFAICVIMFHLANAAMLPLAASMLTLRSGEAATIMVAAAIVVPQFTVVLLSPWVGRTAHRIGRRPMLMLGFGALTLRGLLFALLTDPVGLVIVQILDGISAAALGVLVPLIIVDVTREQGHFNLAQGVVGCGMGIGAAISTTLAGYTTDNFGSHSAFNMLSMLAAAGFVIVVLAMPETKPRPEAE
jgi:MFS family permease